MKIEPILKDISPVSVLVLNEYLKIMELQGYLEREEEGKMQEEGERKNETRNS